MLNNRKQRIATHFSKAKHYDNHAKIQLTTCQQLLGLINQPHQTSVLEVGAGSGQMTKLLATHIKSPCWVINELSANYAPLLQNILPQAHLVIGDAETLPLDQTALGYAHSLIVSANAVQWFDNPLHFIKRVAKQLGVGGQLVFNTFTPNNFMQIKSLTGQGLTYPSVLQWQACLQQHGFTDIELMTEQYELAFDTPYDVLKHIKQTGVSTHHTQGYQNQKRYETAQNEDLTSSSKADASIPFRWTKASLQQFDSQYRQQFSKNNQVILTYDVLLIKATKLTNH